MPSADQWPRPFGRYTLLAPLAQGGMGDVCIALSGSVSGAERLCVVKTIRMDLANDSEFLARFMDEGRVVCALTHPNIAQIVEVGVEDGVPFLAMEFVAGEDLDRVMQSAQRSSKPLPLEFIVTCVAGILEGLSYAHRATSLDGKPLQLVHRDISPQNVRVSWDGDVKVLDFGTARAAVRQTQTMHGVVFGKPGYMSPEQARGEPLDGRTDLFALGIVTWELLAGAEMARDHTEKYMQAVAHGDLVLAPLREMRPEIPAALDEWIAQMTRFERDRRFSDAATARRALLNIALENRLRVDREIVVDTLDALLAEERDTSRSYVSALVARGRASRAATPQRGASPAEGEAAVAPLEVLPPRSPDPTAPGVIPGTRYRVGARLGSGAMGEVFAAEHVDLGRQVALKVLYPEHSNKTALAQRFRMEARAIASLSHPNLVQVLDFGTTADGRLFYAMERLEGQTLRDRIESLRRLTPAEALRVGAQIARGLAKAHAVGLVHRDLKPENVFLTGTGAVKLLDFGVAKSTDPSFWGGQFSSSTLKGEVFGSPGYISPEQGTGKEVDARTDIYSLGAVLYEALTGTRVFDGETLVEVLARHLAEPPQPMVERAPGVEVPLHVETLVRECLEKDPARRPQSAEQLVDRLEAALGLLERGDDAAVVGARTGITRRAPSVPPPPDAPVTTVAQSPMPAAPKVLWDSAADTVRVKVPDPSPRRSPVWMSGAFVGAAVAAVVLLSRQGPPSVDLSERAAPPTVARAEPPSSGETMVVTDNEGTRGEPASSTAAARLRGRENDDREFVERTPSSAVTMAEESSSHRRRRSPMRTVHRLASAGRQSAPAPAVPVDAVPMPDHFARAQLALEQRRLPEAAAAAIAAISAHQRPIEARNLLGLAYMRMGQRTQAVSQWRIVLAREPSNLPARRYLRAAGEDPDRP